MCHDEPSCLIRRTGLWFCYCMMNVSINTEAVAVYHSESPTSHSVQLKWILLMKLNLTNGITNLIPAKIPEKYQLRQCCKGSEIWRPALGCLCCHLIYSCHVQEKQNGSSSSKNESNSLLPHSDYRHRDRTDVDIHAKRASAVCHLNKAFESFDDFESIYTCVIAEVRRGFHCQQKFYDQPI